ncbi:TPA: histidine--tRNA ligase [Candidatus Latescibacteria bacterium]|nr:histidine--tRNA ligase [Candidatus Latescibacterota bacterium]
MASKIIPNVKGTRDFYPDDWAYQKWLSGKFLEVGRLFGFEEYEGSLLEHQDLYLGKSSEEIVNQQTFTLKDRDDRDLVLRPELTPSLARMVASREGQLAFPIRWQSYGQFFRYERPQRGRGRAFFQWNVDLLGADSPVADAEILSLACATFKTLDLTPDHVTLRLNDRQAAESLLRETLGIRDDLIPAVFGLIDRVDKMDPEKFKAALAEAGLGGTQASELQDILQSKSPIVSDWLTEIMAHLSKAGVESYIQLDPRIVRGFDYYTRTVFEAWAKTSLRRALFGGGRYDNLTLQVGGKRQIPGVGFAVGDMALTELLKEVEKMPDAHPTEARVLVTVFAEDLLDTSSHVAATLRRAGIPTELYLTPKHKLDRQFKHADKKAIRYVVVLGPDEAAADKASLKDLRTGDQVTLAVGELVDRISQN